MGRRHVKEYRPDEALSLIAADRDAKPLRCPSCGGTDVRRDPPRPRSGVATPGRVELRCEGCSRVVSYIDRVESPARMA